MAGRRPPPKPLQGTSNSSVQLTLVAVWRHTVLAGSGQSALLLASVAQRNR